ANREDEEEQQPQGHAPGGRLLLIFWDYYNMPLPEGFHHCGLIASYVVEVVSRAFPRTCIAAGMKQTPYRPEVRGRYQMSDYHHRQLTQAGWRIMGVDKSGADDRMLQEDMLKLATAIPDSVVVLIGSDSDFCDVIQQLHRNGTDVL